MSPGSRSRNARSWKTFARRDGLRIEREFRAGRSPRCPACDDLLEAEPGSRLETQVVLDARAFDLTCRACRRFWCCIQHTARSLRLLRMRRLAAAVRAVEPMVPRSARLEAPLAAPTAR